MVGQSLERGGSLRKKAFLLLLEQGSLFCWGRAVGSGLWQMNDDQCSAAGCGAAVVRLTECPAICPFGGDRPDTLESFS
ncbi:hypothetical protein ACQ0QQ_04855 [Lysinibacillus sphaericus]